MGLKHLQGAAWAAAALAVALSSVAQPAVKEVATKWPPLEQNHDDEIGSTVAMFTHVKPLNFAAQVRAIMRIEAKQADRGIPAFDSFRPEDRALLLAGIETRAAAVKKASLVDGMCSLEATDAMGRARSIHAATRAHRQALDDATYAHIAGLTRDGVDRLMDRVGKGSGQTEEIDWVTLGFSRPETLLRIANDLCAPKEGS